MTKPSKEVEKIEQLLADPWAVDIQDIEEERANLRFLKATEGTPVTEFKDAKEVADWLNDPDED
ncbi:hypothetical protein [Lentilactobacillus hilgardii]|uniref:hypothetical protein n=1 Tax=Lentilactobacillus hilgardii TaxID=1588 RepID=UPI00390C9518